MLPSGGIDCSRENGEKVVLEEVVVEEEEEEVESLTWTSSMLL